MCRLCAFYNISKSVSNRLSLVENACIKCREMIKIPNNFIVIVLVGSPYSHTYSWSHLFSHIGFPE